MMVPRRGQEGRTIIGKRSIKWVAKAQPLCKQDKGKALPREKAIPKEQDTAVPVKFQTEDKAKSIAQTDQSKTSQMNDDEFKAWLSTFDNDRSDSEGPVFSINMVETRGGAHSAARPRKASTMDQEEETGAEYDEGDEEYDRLVLETKDKDERISSLETKLEEAMRAITILTKRSPGILIQEPAGGSTSKGKATGQEEERIHPPLVSRVDEHATTIASLDEIVQRKVTAALTASQNASVVRKGRPYPVEYESVPYPPGFTTPHFKLFDGTGNPRQHIAHFRAGCCNAGGSDALLLKQFVTSLAGVAIEWYIDLPNDSFTTFNEMEDAFVKRFATTQQRITILDLINEERKSNETLTQFIIRWRNLSLQCEPPIAEEHAVGIILKRIKGPISLMLSGFDIDTFQVLLNKVAKCQHALDESSPQQKEKEKTFKGQRQETRVARVAQMEK